MRQTSTTLAGSQANGHGTLGRKTFRRDLPPDTLRRLIAAFKRQWKRYRKGLKRCQKAFSEDAVHESRVETRRLLSNVELLGPFIASGRVKKIRAALKRHLDTFDDLRDTQVQLLAVGKMLRSFPGMYPFHDFLLKRETSFAAKTRKRIKRIKTKRLGKLIATARQEVKRQRRNSLSPDANALLLRSIDAAFARTRRLKERVDPKDTLTIHCTRVAFKKFRYMVETLTDCLPLPNEKLLAAMHHYQTMMGDIQDVEVLLRTLDKFQRRQEIELEPTRRFREELLRRRQWLIRAYLGAADQLFDFWPELPAIWKSALARSAARPPGNAAAKPKGRER